MNNGKTLLAGPWVGEFGWELFCWQGHIRRLSRSYEKTYVISRPGNGFLYQDFADKLFEFDPLSWDTSMHRCHNIKADAMELVRSIRGFDDYFSGNFQMPFTLEKNVLNDLKGLFFKQEFYKYKPTKEVKKIDILIHPRNKSTGALRNWDEKKWISLVDQLKDEFTIGLIGNEQAFNLENTEDLRGIGLEELCNQICSSQIIIGPSSGPMHFASLCGKRHLVWSDNENEMRYKKFWNPFETEVIFIDEGGWDPDVDLIAEKTRESIGVARLK